MEASWLTLLAVRRPCRCGGEAEAVAGSAATLSTTLTCRPSRIEAPGGVSVSLHGGILSVEAVYKTAGRRSVWLSCIRAGPLGFFELAERSGPIVFSVEPRTRYWALAASRTASSRGSPTGRRSGGSGFLAASGEYLESREYTPGLPWRRMDWRAYAATGRFMVRLYEWAGEEAGAPVWLLYDGSCLGSYTCDVLASSMLSIAVSAEAEGRGLHLCRLWGSGCRPAGVAEVLEEAMRILGEGGCRPSIYQYSSPLSALDAVRMLGGSPGAVGGVGGWEGGGVVYIVSCLVAGGGLGLLGLVESLRSRGIGVVVVAPGEPWLDAPGYGGALRETLEAMVSSLEDAGAVVRLVS